MAAFVSLKIDTVELQKSKFFDRDAVINSLTPAELKALSKMGAYVRTTARSSLKYATKKQPSSSPGQPPRVHRKQYFRNTSRNAKNPGERRLASPLKELIYFTYDEGTHSVVIGPTGFRHDRPNPVPRVLEFGGVSSIVKKYTVRSATTGRRAGARQAQAYRKKLQDGSIVASKSYYVEKAITIARRPFMAPALTKNMSKFAGLFSNLDLGARTQLGTNK